MTTTSISVQMFKNPVFDRIMCKDTRILRDEVYDFVYQYYHAPTIEEFELQCFRNYSPLTWEAASLYASHEQIFEAIQRKTSASFYKDGQGDEKVRGSVKGSRYKDVDWESVLRCDAQWWYNAVKFPRAGAMQPSTVTGPLATGFMYVYMEFTKWLLTDFTYTTLHKILEISTKYSVTEVSRCMGMVEDYTKRSVDYLSSVLEKEQAINMALLRDKNVLNESSQKTLEALLKIRDESHGPIDWDKLKAEIDEQFNIQAELDKVKLS